MTKQKALADNLAVSVAILQKYASNDYAFEVQIGIIELFIQEYRESKEAAKMEHERHYIDSLERCTDGAFLNG